MRFKKSLLIICLIICIFTMVSVSAADVNDTAIASQDTDQMELSTDDGITEDNLQANNEETVSAETDSEILTDGQYTYSDLREQIGSGGNKSLTKGAYTYKENDGDTIQITDSGVIEGNGAIIDMAESTIRAFDVSASNVTIKNLTIINANYGGDGGAIYFGQSGTIDNCNFYNNSVGSKGGAVYFNNDGFVTNCNFIDNKAVGRYNGGAVYFNNDGFVTNCNFTNNSATSNGAAVSFGYSYGTYREVKDCNFNGNIGSNSGALYFSGGSANSVINCNFSDNKANYRYYNHGGAIYFDYTSGIVINCTFTNNAADAEDGEGGAIKGSDLKLFNCTFINNVAYYGGALHGGEAYNCTFINNNANQDGGAVYKSKAYDCIFKGNGAKYGGAFYENEAYNCTFIANTAKEQGGAVFNGKALDCNFSENYASKEGGAMFEGTVGLCYLNTAIDTIYNTNVLPTFNVSKRALRFDLADRLLFNFTYDNKNYDGYNTTITLAQDGNTVGVYYALSGSDEGWAMDLNPGVYTATLSMKHYTAKPITVTILTGIDAGKYSEMSGEIGSGGDIELQHDYYAYDSGSTIEITEPNTIIDGRGAVIDMFGSNIRAFTVNASNVTIKNLTIKNANCDMDGGAIYFNQSGTVINCSFTDNKVTSEHAGGAISGDDFKSIDCTFINNAAYRGGALHGGEAYNCSFINNSADRDGGAIYKGNAYDCNFTENHAGNEGGAIFEGSTVGCYFISNSAYGGGALRGGEAYNCSFINNSADQDGGAVHGCKAYDCTFSGNSAKYGGAFYEKEAYNCDFTNNTARENGGAVFKGKADNCNFTDNHAKEGGAMYEGTAGLCFLNTTSDTLHNTNILPTFAVLKSFLRFDLADRLLFNLTGDNKNYDGYNTTITLAQDDNPVGVYYALSGSDEGWAMDLNPGVYTATLSMKHYTAKPITVTILTGIRVGNYSQLSREIGSGEDIELQYDYYIYDSGSTIEITKPNTVIDGRGAVIDMSGSTVQAFKITAFNVTVKNLTIKNANSDEYGGAIYFGQFGNVENCIFADNSGKWGGAIWFEAAGSVARCNFTNNVAPSGGGAIWFYGEGNVTNCNFADNTANGGYCFGGAIWMSYGRVENCNFTHNIATDRAGGVYFDAGGNVTNCNFVDNGAYGRLGDSGAIWFKGEGNVTNCNFTNNWASLGSGAIRFCGDGSATECIFTSNIAPSGGAIYFQASGKAINCNFINNTATSGFYGGGGIYFASSYGNCHVIGCNFTGNAGDWGPAIYFYSSSGNRTISNSTFLDNRASAEDLQLAQNGNDIVITFIGKNNLLNAIYSPGDVDFTNVTYWSAKGIVNTDDYPPINSKNEAGQNITVIGVVNGNLINIVGITNDEGSIVIDGGAEYYLIVRHDENSYYTGIERTFTNMNFYVNVTSLATTNRTVNITAKSNIYSEVMPGGLHFIVTNAGPIDASYVGNGTWWVVHIFDDYADYKVSAFYSGLDNVNINNAIITISKVNSTLTVSNITFDYGGEGFAAVNFTNASGVVAEVIGQPDAVVGVNDTTITVSGLDAGNYTLTVTTITDANHNNITKNATITVNKAKTQLTADAITTTYNINKDLVITLKDANGNALSGMNVTVDLNGAKTYVTDANCQVKIPTKGLAANIYDVLISFNGTDNYLNSSNTTTVSIYKESSRVDTKPLTTDYNVHKYLVVGLKDNEGNPIRNADAYIEIHGVTYKCRSDDAGNARLIIRLNPGTYAAKITFDNVNYTGFTQYVTVIVKKATPKLTAKKKTFKKSKKVKKYTVTLKDNNGKAMAKVKLTLKVKGKTYKAKTNAKGKATFKIKKLTKKGKFKATVKFKGNNRYKKVTKKVKITVK